LYVRAERSVRIVMEDASLAVYGPGELFRQHDYEDVVAATLAHSTLEQELVRDGWSLEQMTTERRSRSERRTQTRGDRRRGLRLVRKPATLRD
jgi:hypothetical protein